MIGPCSAANPGAIGQVVLRGGLLSRSELTPRGKKPSYSVGVPRTRWREASNELVSDTTSSPSDTRQPETPVPDYVADHPIEALRDNVLQFRHDARAVAEIVCQRILAERGQGRKEGQKGVRAVYWIHPRLHQGGVASPAESSRPYA